MPILSVQNLTKTFTSGFWPFTARQSYTAVNNISFEIKPGEILGFLGPNGAGKTTTIQMLLGTLTPTHGTILHRSKNIVHDRVKCLKDIGYMSGYDGFPGRLTALGFLDIAGRIHGLSAAQNEVRIKELLSAFGMWEKRNNEMASFSAGQRTRIMLAKAFIANPKLVLLDEPTASLDPDITHDVRRFILEQRKTHNTSLLITSHNMEEVAELCDRVLVLKQGSIIADNSPAELARSTSNAKISLAVPQHAEQLYALLNVESLSFTQQGNVITIHLDEEKIPHLLTQLGQRHILYSHISIEKPTLEDYFLTITK